MSTRRLAEREMDLDSGGASQDEEATQLLLLALRELQDRLQGPGDGGPAPASEDLERWKSGDYFYLEAALPGAADAEIDVNIQGGRAFIRMAR